MNGVSRLSPAPRRSWDAAGGVPIDAEFFDVSGVQAVPAPGEATVLASFTLPPQYCGVLLYFSQFTDAFARSPEHIETPGLLWMVQSNGTPMHPYIGIEHIINPWGYGSFELGARIEESATLDVVVQNLAYPPTSGHGSGQEARVTRIGGRIMGRYWYNPAYGSPPRHGS